MSARNGPGRYARSGSSSSESLLVRLDGLLDPDDELLDLAYLL